jgi:hypothetical protein
MMNALTRSAGERISWMRSFLSRPQDEPASRATERFIILGDDADEHMFHAPVGWVDDPKCAVGFMRRDAAAITRWRLAAQGRGKITNVRVERVA